MNLEQAHLTFGWVGFRTMAVRGFYSHFLNIAMDGRDRQTIDINKRGDVSKRAVDRIIKARLKEIHQ